MFGRFLSTLDDSFVFVFFLTWYTKHFSDHGGDVLDVCAHVLLALEMAKSFTYCD